MKSRFCAKLDKAIEDEKKAPQDYEELKKAGKNEDRGAIGKIQGDERSHLKTLKLIKEKRC